MNLGDILGRVPRTCLFVTAGLLQVALIGLMVADRVHILRSGTEVALQTRAVDPRDFLRGDYVALNCDISSVPIAGPKDRWTAKRGETIFVRLTPNADGYYRAVLVQADLTPVTSPDILIRGRVVGTGRIKYGIESYFVPQGEGRDIEQARNQGKVAIVAAVTPTGRAAIKRLLIDGKPVYNEPLFLASCRKGGTGFHRTSRDLILKENYVRTFTAAATIATVLLINVDGPAQAAPWCAWFTGYSYNYDCSYYTFEQCLATIHGVGGYCARNVYPEPPLYPPGPYRKKAPRRHD